jgi:hypothetical protein
MRDGPRCPKQVSLKSDLLLPPTKFSKVYFFQRMFKDFFDGYFVVKSLLRLSKLLVESNDVFKTVLGSKIRTPYAEILAFF